jgi:hypothetical protein
VARANSVAAAYSESASTSRLSRGESPRLRSAARSANHIDRGSSSAAVARSTLRIREYASANPLSFWIARSYECCAESSRFVR